MSHCQRKKLTSHTFLRVVEPEILSNIFGAFTNEHPVQEMHTHLQQPSMLHMLHTESVHCADNRICTELTAGLLETSLYTDQKNTDLP